MAAKRRGSDQNKALMQRFYDEVANGGNFDLVDELLSADFVDYEDVPGSTPGREGVKEFFATFREAFPDAHFTVDQMVAEDNLVAAHVTIRGTHTGTDFMGLPPSGKSVEVSAMDLVQIVDGIATAHWGVSDMTSMAAQLGVAE